MAYEKLETRFLATPLTFMIEVTATKVNENRTLQGLSFKIKSKGIEVFCLPQTSGTYFKVDKDNTAGIKISSEKTIAPAVKKKFF